MEVKRKKLPFVSIDKRLKKTISRISYFLIIALLFAALPGNARSQPAPAAAGRVKTASVRAAPPDAAPAGSPPPAAAAHAGQAPISRVKVRDALLFAAWRYNTRLKPEDIMKGSPGEGVMHYLRPATRLEAIVMISRAFGRLPAPAGDLSRRSDEVPAYSDIPQWARADVENLANARVLLPSPDGMLKGDETLGETEFYIILNRIYALFANEPKDDFYRAVNKEWLDASAIRAGECENSVFGELEETVEARLNYMIDGILAKTWRKGSGEQKISDLYRCIIDIEGRNKAGAEPIKAYLNKIAYAKDMIAFEKALNTVSEELGIDLFFGFRLEPDIYNSNRYSLYLTHPAPTLPKYVAEDYRSSHMLALSWYAITLFTLAGFENPVSGADDVLKIESMLAKAQRDPAAQFNYADEYRQYGFAWLEDMLPDADFDRIMGISGLKPAERFYVADRRLLSAFADIYNMENLWALKAYASFKLIDAFANMLSQPFADARFTLMSSIMGTPEKPDPELEAKRAIRSLMSAYLGKAYADKYLPDSVREDVETLADVIISVYANRIGGVGWMSASARDAAKKKLETVKVKAGAPRTWNNAADMANVTGQAEGGTYFSNMTAHYRDIRAGNAKKQGRAADKNVWDASVFTVDAFYRPAANEIVIPAGLLQPPFYVQGGPAEANLGGVGCAIAHELTHAIDYGGSQFDESGNAKCWWSEEDKARFNLLRAETAAFYGGYEAAPGIAGDGWRTATENIADLGMVACMLDVMATLPNPDYKLFFTSAAGVWAETSTRNALDIRTKNGVHASGNARVNKTFQNFQDFYDTFHVEIGDGMYAPPDMRIKIW